MTDDTERETRARRFTQEEVKQAQVLQAADRLLDNAEEYLRGLDPGRAIAVFFREDGVVGIQLRSRTVFGSSLYDAAAEASRK